MSSPRADAYLLEDIAGDQVPRVAPMIEVGKTGLRRVGGYVEEEFLPQLRGRKAVAIYREMADNDPIVGAELYAIGALLRQIEWRVEPASQKGPHKADAEFVEQCMADMSHSWGDLIAEIVTMNTYGWSYHELVYKRRIGPWETDARKKSKHTDGRIGWRKIPIRGQETLLRWVFDTDGGIQAMVQMSPPSYDTKVIPIGKALLFRTTSVKNNPEGRSLLRNAYRPWFVKKRIEEFEAIGVERDLAGLPVGGVPAEYLNAAKGTDQAKMVEAFRKMVRSVRRDENEGIVMPLAYDPDTKEPLFKFELLNSGGSRQFDTSGIIQRYEQRILMAVLADFILIGHEGTGSYAMHTDKRGLFQTAMNALAQSIADVFNRHAIPRLFSLNAMKPDELPSIVPNNVDPPDLTQLSAFMTAMTSAGMTWFPDPELEKFVRDAAQLPELDPDIEAVREIQQRQAAIMELAQQRLAGIQMEQQAEQGELANTAQAVQTGQAAEAAAAGPPGAPPKDPIQTKRDAVGLATDQTKHAQEKQKLVNLKKPPPKPAGPPARKKAPVKKSYSAFGIEHGSRP